MASRHSVKPNPAATDVVGARIGAQIIDLIIMFVQVMVIAIGLAFLVRPETEVDIRGFVGLAFLSLPLYGGLLEGFWNGQTVGKRMTGIRVVDRRSEEPTLWQALVRNAPAVILFSWLTTAVALAAIAMDDHHQRVFDAIAGTYVVKA